MLPVNLPVLGVPSRHFGVLDDEQVLDTLRPRRAAAQELVIMPPWWNRTSAGLQPSKRQP
jgi:hypothetical protein